MNFASFDEALEDQYSNARKHPPPTPGFQAIRDAIDATGYPRFSRNMQAITDANALAEREWNALHAQPQ